MVGKKERDWGLLGIGLTLIGQLVFVVWLIATISSELKQVREDLKDHEIESSYYINLIQDIRLKQAENSGRITNLENRK